MKSHVSLALGALALAFALAPDQSAQAQMLVVPNFSFETPALGDNGDAVYDNSTNVNWIWTLGNTPAYGTSTGQHAGIENPNGKFGGDNTGTGTITGADGVNAAFMNTLDSGGNATITSAASLATVTSGTRYTLTVAVGNPAGGGTQVPGSFTIALLVNGTAATNFTLTNANTAITDGAFADFSTTFTATGAQAGGALTVQLFSVNQGTGNGNSQIFFDNVRVNTAVPEPSTWAAVAGGGVGLLLVVRRRRARC